MAEWVWCKCDRRSLLLRFCLFPLGAFLRFAVAVWLGVTHHQHMFSRVLSGRRSTATTTITAATPFTRHVQMINVAWECHTMSSAAA